VEGWRERGGLLHPNAVTMREQALEVFARVERPEEEVVLRRIEVEAAREEYGQGAPALAQPLTELGRVLVLTERGEEAVEVLEEALGLMMDAPAGDAELVWTQVVYGAALGQEGRVEEAEGLFEGAGEMLEGNRARWELADRWMASVRGGH